MSYNPVNNGIVASTNNSSTAPLAAGSTFTGVADDLSNYPELDINLAGSPAAAPMTLFFEFSPDGVNWDVSVPVNLAGPNMVPLPLRTVLRFFRVRIVNGVTPQTQLRLTTTLHYGNASRLTRFLNQSLGNLEPVEVVSAVLVGQNGANSRLLPDGNLWVRSGFRLLGDALEAPALDTAQVWSTTVVGIGTVVQANGEITISSGATAVGSAQLQSQKRAVFQPTSPLNMTLGVRLNNTGVVSNTRRWGLYDANN